MFEKLKELMDSMIDMGIPGASILVKQHGMEIYRYATGFSDREKQIPMTGNERVYIYSCSKVITCTAALQLWEKGKFDLDDELGKYMPEFAEMSVRTPEGCAAAKNKITIRDLFRMSAGMDYNLTSPPLMKARAESAGECPTRETVCYMAQQPLLYEPGQGWQYSLAHDVIAALVEVISGEKFEDYVEKHIFAPLGIKNSTFVLKEDEKDTIAPLYRNDPLPDSEEPRIERIRCANVYIFGPKYASGGAGCVSTLDDYSTFLEGLKDGKLLKAETVKMMSTDMLEEGAQRTGHDEWCGSGTYGYGLGVRCAPSTGESSVTDYGWGGAAGAYLAIDPVNDLTVFYVQHVLNSPNKLQRTQILPLIQEVVAGTSASRSAGGDRENGF